MRCAAGTTASLFAKEKEAHEKNAICSKTVFSLRFAPQSPNRLYGSSSRSEAHGKLMVLWGSEDRPNYGDVSMHF